MKANKTTHRKPTMKQENDAAMQEMRDSATKILRSVTNISKTVNWKSVLPKVLIGMVVLYGLRNRKMLSGIVTSAAVGMLSEDFGGKISDAFKSVSKNLKVA